MRGQKKKKKNSFDVLHKLGIDILSLGVGCLLRYRLVVSFYHGEGDREAELGLPFSPLCDRKSTLVAESQIGMSTKGTQQKHLSFCCK